MGNYSVYITDHTTLPSQPVVKHETVFDGSEMKLSDLCDVEKANKGS